MAKRTGQETLLRNYYTKLATHMLTEYKNPDWNNPIQVQEFCRFRELYLLMVCSCETIGDFETAIELSKAYENVVGIPCKREVFRHIPKTTETKEICRA